MGRNRQERRAQTLARVVVTLGLMMAVGIPAVAQTTTGSAAGRVVDADGAALPGVTITYTSLGQPAERVLTTNADGAYRALDLPPGMYKVTAELEGFATVERNVEIRLGQIAVAHFWLNLSEVAEEIITSGENPTNHTEVIAIASAATGRLPVATQSDIAVGSIATVFGINVGPDPFFRPADLANLAPGIGVREAFILSAGVRHDTFGVFGSPNQSSVVIPSSIDPTNIDNAFLLTGVTANPSPPYAVNIVLVQPGFFTTTSNGLGEGIFTDADFELITKTDAATTDQFLIGWGSGHGPAPVDNTGVAFDKRDIYDEYRLLVGGVDQVNPAPTYVGAAGGFGGGDQMIWPLNHGVPTGCGVPIYDWIRIGDDIRVSNVVTIPISADGGPCGDPHGFNAERIELLKDGPVKIGEATLTEVVTVTQEGVEHSTELSFLGQSYTALTYSPPTPWGTCKVNWTPDGFQDAFAPAPLEFSGAFTWKLPGTTVLFDELTGDGPYQATIARLTAEQRTEGPYEVSTTPDFTVNGEPFTFSATGEYSRDAGRAMDAMGFGLIDTSQVEGFLSPVAVMDIAAEEGVGNDVYLTYELRVDHGPFGSYLLNCSMSGGAAELAAARDSIQQQSRDMAEFLPSDPEAAAVVIGLGAVDTNSRSHEGALDASEEKFEAKFEFLFLTGELTF